MSAIIQYDLFKDIPSQEEVEQIKFISLKESCDKMRRKLFAENGGLKKRCFELEARLEIIERNICQKN